jgi:tagatose 1,6-diphosphate aldolase GatY/KbaY
MTIASPKELLIEATKRKYAVGAFNITNLVQLEAIFEAHEELKAPLIIQNSVSTSKFLGPDVMVAIFHALAGSTDIPVALQLDHCRDLDYCKECADAGYTGIMIDASHQKFEENICQTKEVVHHCRSLGRCSVEGELGTISGIEGEIRVEDTEVSLCDPNRAVEFVEKTGVDLLAPAIGTVHGLYKSAKPTLDFDRFERIFQNLNGTSIKTPLVIHGSTGLTRAHIRRLIDLGCSKFNISTDIQRSLIDTTYDYISQHRDEYDPGKLHATVRDAVRNKAMGWIDILGSA